MRALHRLDPEAALIRKEAEEKRRVRQHCPATAQFDTAYYELRKARGPEHARTRAAYHAHWRPEKLSSARRDAERYFAKATGGAG